MMMIHWFLASRQSFFLFPELRTTFALSTPSLLPLAPRVLSGGGAAPSVFLFASCLSHLLRCTSPDAVPNTCLPARGRAAKLLNWSSGAAPPPTQRSCCIPFSHACEQRAFAFVQVSAHVGVQLQVSMANGRRGPSGGPVDPTSRNLP